MLLAIALTFAAFPVMAAAGAILSRLTAFPGILRGIAVLVFLFTVIFHYQVIGFALTPYAYDLPELHH